jgi:hypothetical protein
MKSFAPVLPLFALLLACNSDADSSGRLSTDRDAAATARADASTPLAGLDAGERPSRGDAAITQAPADGGPLSIRPPESCTGLFGRPAENTGLTPEQCKPECSCGDGVYRPPTYDESDLADLESWTLLDPPSEILESPYDATPRPEPSPSQVCAFVPDATMPKAYRLATFDSEAAARAASGRVTHTGACGACSPLRDLAAYIRRSDLTTPVRQCGLDHFAGPKEAHIACLEKLGFQRPCAQIWYYNTVHTRNACLVPCLAGLNMSYHEPDGTLNACIQCDEDESGPVFKAVAGRTRRSSGLPDELCRPCNTVSRIIHHYP